MELSTIKLLIYGSYGLTILVAYFLIAMIYHINRSGQIKLLGFTLDPKRVSRNRKTVKNSLERASKEKRMALIWPVFLIKGFVAYVKEKLKKEE
jgi:hypothetical protein|tara:strand:+ start:3421 stop:3702 length:282 start_codon:yes stop_codon:yes gene_type:complete